MTNLDSILKSRDITLPTKVHLVKAMVFPVVMYGCENWPIKKLSIEELMLLNCGVGEDSRISWTARRPNQSILKEISPEYSLEGLMLKLKHQYIDHLMQRTDSLEKPLMVGKIEGRRRTGWHKLRWLDGITKWMDMTLSKLRVWWWTGKPGMLQSMWSQRVWHTEWLNWKLLKTSFWFKNYGKIIIVELFPLCIEYSYLSSFSLLVMTIETILNIYYEHCWKLSSVSVCLFLKKIPQSTNYTYMPIILHSRNGFPNLSQILSIVLCATVSASLFILMLRLHN